MRGTGWGQRKMRHNAQNLSTYLQKTTAIVLYTNSTLAKKAQKFYVHKVHYSAM